MLTPSQVETLFADPQNLKAFVGKRVLELHLIRPAGAGWLKGPEREGVCYCRWMSDATRVASEHGISGPFYNNNPPKG